MNLSSVRKEITTALEDLEANVYWFPPETSILPAVIVVPDAPYIEPIAFGRNFRVAFKLTFGVNSRDNQAALDNIESLVFAAYAALPQGWEISDTSAPNPVSLNGSDIIACDFTISKII